MRFTIGMVPLGYGRTVVFQAAQKAFGLQIRRIYGWLVERLMVHFHLLKDNNKSWGPLSVRLWHQNNGPQLLVLDEPFGERFWMYGIVFHPTKSLLATQREDDRLGRHRTVNLR